MQFHNLLSEKFGKEIIFGIFPNASPICIEINPQYLTQICEFLYANENCYFDTLSCVSGLHCVNNNANNTENHFEVWYHLFSLPHQHSLALKAKLSLENPKIATISHIWQTANWHEREIFDMFGIIFENHPELKRILLPADWEGYPLRKDYKIQENYHGIEVKY